MKLPIYLFFLFFVGLRQISASEDCFLAKENGILLQIDEINNQCKMRYTPASTFKIPLSLIGFDSGILQDEFNPMWQMPKDAIPFISAHKGSHNPKEWIRDSAIWYSQELTKKLGIEKFQKYINEFSYGNMDLSGGLTEAWISSSLKISPEEQIEFLQKILDHKFSLSDLSYEKTKNILFVGELSGGWKLYGKTGNDRLLDLNGNKTFQHGWFVGWIEKAGRKIVFAKHIADTDKQENFASFRAKNDALLKIFYLTNELDK